MLALVELKGYDARKPNQISGGQAQRVALARALINRPAVLLLDEPLGALDLKLRKQMQVELKRIQQEVGITFIYVTHDQEEAMTMSDRIAVMNKGRYEQLGQPEELYERPKTQLRGRLPGRQQPAADAARRDAPTDTPSAAWPTTRRSACRPRSSRRRSALRSASGPRRSGSYETGDTLPAGMNVARGVVRDASYLGVSTQYIVDLRSATRRSPSTSRTSRGRRADSLFDRGEEARSSGHLITRSSSTVGSRRPRRRRRRPAPATQLEAS